MKIRIILDLSPIEVSAMLVRFGFNEHATGAAGKLRQFLTLHAHADIDAEVGRYLARKRGEERDS